MKQQIEKGIFLTVLFLYALSAWNLAGYWFAALTVMYLGMNLPRIRFGFPEILLLLFSGFYFLFYRVHYGVSWKGTVNFLWGPWAAFLLGKLYVQQTSGEEGFWQIITVLSAGFFFHGLLNFLTYLGSERFSQAYAYQRISLDVWQGTVTSVTGNGLLLSFAAGLSLGILLSGKGERKRGAAALCLALCMLITVFYANRTLLCIAALLVVWRLCGKASGRLWGKFLLAGGFLAVFLGFLWVGNFGGFRNWILSWKLAQRLGEAPGRLYAWSFFFRNGGLWRHPFGGGHLTEDAPTPYLHNLWLDVYNAAGIFPFAMLVCFSLWAAYRIWCFEKYGKETGKRQTAAAFTCLMGAAFFNMMVEPVLEANPYYFQTVLIFLGAMEGEMVENRIKKPSFESKEGKRGGTMQLGSGEKEELELRHLVEAIFRSKGKIFLAVLGGGVLALLVTLLLMPPKYQVVVMFHANNTASQEGRTAAITNSDLVTSRNLVDSYIVLLFTGETLSEIGEQADFRHSRKELETMIRAEVVEDTELFRVIVTSQTPEEAQRVAEAVEYILPGRIAQILEGSSAKVVDGSGRAERCASGYGRNALLGALAGLLLCMGIVLVQALFDTTIRREEDICKCCDLPLLAVVPVSGGCMQPYHLLAAKLEHLYRNQEGIALGLIGPQSLEETVGIPGKIAAALSWSGKAAVVLETDLTHPVLGERLHLRKTPGLWEYFRQEASLRQILRVCRSFGEDKVFSVIPAGQKPQGTLSRTEKAEMEKLLEELKERFDYLLLPLPSLEASADALVLAGSLDGILLTVEQHHCRREQLTELIQNLKFLDIRILGIVFQKTARKNRRATKEDPYAGKYARICK